MRAVKQLTLRCSSQNVLRSWLGTNYAQMEDINDSLAFEEFLEWSVAGQLQFYLMRKGKSTTGNKKDRAVKQLPVNFEIKTHNYLGFSLILTDG